MRLKLYIYEKKTQKFPEIKVVNLQEINQIFSKTEVVNLRVRYKSIYHYLILFKTLHTPWKER